MINPPKSVSLVESRKPVRCGKFMSFSHVCSLSVTGSFHLSRIPYSSLSIAVLSLSIALSVLILKLRIRPSVLVLGLWAVCVVSVTARFGGRDISSLAT